MPVHFRAQCLFPTDSAEPKDVINVNPCFRHDLDIGSWDPQGLADDLVNIWKTTCYNGNSRPIQVRLYDIEGTKPVYPLAVASSNWTAGAPNTGMMRQAACALSFYAGMNVPRRRGRLYIPPSFFSNSATVLTREVDNTVLTGIATLPAKFAGLGGVDVDWIVWSGRDHAAHIVTNWFIDNSWDVIRSRKLKGTARVTGTTGG